DVHLYDDSERPTGALARVQMAPVTRAALGFTFRDWLYGVEWRETDATAAGAGEGRGVVGGDEAGVATALRAGGATCVTVRAGAERGWGATRGRARRARRRGGASGAWCGSSTRSSAAEAWTSARTRTCRHWWRSWGRRTRKRRWCGGRDGGGCRGWCGRTRAA